MIVGPRQVRRLIWVAAFPLVPGYGATSAKSCGILIGLAEKYQLTVLVNTDRFSEAECRDRLLSFWGRNPPVELRIIRSKARAWRLTGPLRLRFLNESAIDGNRMRAEISAISGERTVPVIMDDAVLSHLVGTIPQPTMHSPHDCLSRLYLAEAKAASGILTKLAYQYRLLVVSRYEKSRYHLARSVHLVNPDDAAILQSKNPKVKVFLCPIASLLEPANANSAVDRDIDLLMWGNFGSGPIRRGAEIALNIIRKNPQEWSTKRIVFLGRRASRLPPGPVTMVERVENLPKFLQRVKVSALPDCDGAGIKNRAMDSLSQGVCLIGIQSQLGGLPTPLDYCIPEQTIEGVLDSTLTVLRNGSYSHFGQAGLRIFRSYLTPSAVGAKFQEHLESYYYNVGRTVGPRSG